MRTPKHVIRFVLVTACVLVRVDARAAQANDAAGPITRLEQIEPDLYYVHA